MQKRYEKEKEFHVCFISSRFIFELLTDACLNCWHHRPRIARRFRAILLMLVYLVFAPLLEHQGD